MGLRIIYFASVREAAGIEEESVDPPPSLATLGDLADWLALRHPVLKDRSRLRAAIDQQMARFDAPFTGASEIAFFPPVTGG